MEKDYPNAPEEDRGNEDGPGRDDTNRTGETLAKFVKDKRKRITRVEKNPGKFDAPGGDGDNRYRREGPREGGDSRPQRPEGGERRSYNPNFTSDNKLRGENPSYRRDSRSYVDTSKDDYFNSEDYNRDRDPRHRADRSAGYDRKPSYGQRSSGYPGGERGYYKDNRQGGTDRGRGGYQGGRPDGDRTGSRPQGPGSRTYGDNRNPGRPGGYGDGRQGGNRYGGASGRPGGYDPRGGGQRKGGYDSRKGKPAFDKDNYPKYPRGQQKEEVRLNRYLSMSGICSRREADELIAAGRVTVNDAVVTEMGSKVMPGDVVRYDGKLVRGESKVYIVMNKPKGFVTSLDDPHAEKTVMDLLKNSVKERVYPVGRLDKNSMGVLLITNDGDMTKKLTHPSHEKKKIYQVTLDKALPPEDMRSIAEGVTLDDGFIRADAIDYVKDDAKEIGIEIHSGRNRIVRRIFEHLGYQVRKLDRVYFAGLTKKNLKRGAWRFLTPREVSALFSGQYE
ncbi:MAG: rRNA pseudouridine synthase [Alistipes sp.]|nr:rRNA pseudouridine synthase [Alistipes sp.]